MNGDRFDHGGGAGDLRPQPLATSLLPGVNAQHAEVMAALARLEHKVHQIMATLSDLQAAVTAEDTVVDSAVALLQGLAAQVAALQPNQAAIDALAKDITDKTKVLADAVVAGTPAPAGP